MRIQFANIFHDYCVRAYFAGSRKYYQLKVFMNIWLISVILSDTDKTKNSRLLQLEDSYMTFTKLLKDSHRILICLDCSLEGKISRISYKFSTKFTFRIAILIKSFHT